MRQSRNVETDLSVRAEPQEDARLGAGPDDHATAEICEHVRFGLFVSWAEEHADFTQHFTSDETGRARLRPGVPAAHCQAFITASAQLSKQNSF